jgi:UDP-glucose:(heptosyl)LPS alpha-1,3-glucosyltransferase
MKIALCHKRLDEKGGTERDFLLTAKGLRDLGHEVHLFCSEYGISVPPGILAHDVPVLRFGRTARLWSFALRAPKIIAQYRCDVVVSFGRMIRQDVLRSGGGSHKVFLQKLARQGGALRRLWHYVSVYHQSLLAIERRQFGPGGFKRAIAVSAQVKGEFIDAYGVSERDIAVLYNGVDHDRFHPSVRQPWRGRIRGEWGIPADALVVLFVGSGFRRKGLDRLIRIWNSPRLENTFLFVVGDDSRIGQYKAWADQQARGRVVFTGRQDEIERYYAAADLVALPAIQEAFGNVVLEALASGLPVVVSRGVGASEVLKGCFAAGIVEDPDAGSQLEETLIKMLGKSRDPGFTNEARRLGEAHSWSNHFHRLETCLMEVCRQGSSGSLS